jgi:hypothetical protein
LDDEKVIEEGGENSESEEVRGEDDVEVVEQIEVNL